MVYIISKNGNPLMPSERHGKIRRLLKEGKAKVIKQCPFTVQLNYDTTSFKQEITLGVDAGSKYIGLSATTNSKELYSSEVQLRNNITKLISLKREHRRERRNRKTRYRKAKYQNRKIEKGWLSPSVKQKIQTHITVIDKITKILPINKIIIEVANFDIQKIKNPEITNEQYAHGEQFNFWNTREYVLWRDGYKCKNCNGKSKDNILNVHHIQSRQTGGDAPNNLITLCETCHKNYHKGLISLNSSIKRGNSFKHATFMGIMRWTLLNELKKKYNNVYTTYGYITKAIRIENNLKKTHYIDARCISGNVKIQPLGIYYYQVKTRCHNRQIHKCTIEKNGYRKKAQTPYEIFGFRTFDKVNYKNQECFIVGKRIRGFFNLQKLDGTVIAQSASYKYIKLIEKTKNIITERRIQYE